MHLERHNCMMLKKNTHVLLSSLLLLLIALARPAGPRELVSFAKAEKFRRLAMSSTEGFDTGNLGSVENRS